MSEMTDERLRTIAQQVLSEHEDDGMPCLRLCEITARRAITAYRIAISESQGKDDVQKKLLAHIDAIADTGRPTTTDRPLTVWMMVEALNECAEPSSDLTLQQILMRNAKAQSP